HRRSVTGTADRRPRRAHGVRTEVASGEGRWRASSQDDPRSPLGQVWRLLDSRRGGRKGPLPLGSRRQNPARTWGKLLAGPPDPDTLLTTRVCVVNNRTGGSGYGAGAASRWRSGRRKAASGRSNRDSSRTWGRRRSTRSRFGTGLRGPDHEAGGGAVTA